jgi:hypothetical protein
LLKRIPHVLFGLGRCVLMTSNVHHSAKVRGAGNARVLPFV